MEDAYFCIRHALKERLLHTFKTSAISVIEKYFMITKFYGCFN